MQQGDRTELNAILRTYKTSTGSVNYPAVLSVPVMERIHAMANKDYTGICAIILGALTVAMESMNLKRGMNSVQLNDLAEAIIDTSGEDNLAFEDLMLFLQKLIRGEYGTTYESMDIPKFMTFFEKYREERWQELNRVRNEQHTQYKVSGDTGRTVQPDELSEHFGNMANRMSDMKTRLTELREQNKNLKMDNL